TATSQAEDFRYEVGTDGISKEGAYDVTIEGFDKANDKLTLIIIGGTSNLTTKEFDSIENVEVISNGIFGTEIYFAPDSSSDSGTLKIPNVEEFIEDLWVATSYTVEIIADINLV
ncbi:MAG: hypothetical protein P8L99_07050, partial [Hyphomicrobiales bacterium]|nr:hypothetical protein [Hyphomicrobiales bacterium]